MHILEMQIKEWMSTYNAGFGLMGKQGTEAIHVHFNKLYRTYGCMENKVLRLKCIIQEHHLSVCPALNALNDTFGRIQARSVLHVLSVVCSSCVATI